MGDEVMSELVTELDKEIKGLKAERREIVKRLTALKFDESLWTYQCPSMLMPVRFKNCAAVLTFGCASMREDLAIQYNRKVEEGNYLIRNYYRQGIFSSIPVRTEIDAGPIGVYASSVCPHCGLLFKISVEFHQNPLDPNNADWKPHISVPDPRTTEFHGWYDFERKPLNTWKLDQLLWCLEHKRFWRHSESSMNAEILKRRIEEVKRRG